MALYEINEETVKLLNAELRLATAFQSIVECAGGYPVADGLVCPHCHSDNPSRDCGRETLPSRGGPGETYFDVGPLSNFKLEEKAMPRAKAKPVKRDYTDTKAKAQVVFIEAVFKLDEEDAGEAIDKAVEELRTCGAAALVRTAAVSESFEEASDILHSRAKEE